MKGKEIIKFLEDWAPKAIAWNNDNVGLQIGNTEIKIKNILVSLDLSDDVIQSAIESECNLIITHHPLLYHPLRRLDFSNDQNARLIQKLIKNNISLYSAHTNLDFTKHGVSFQLAKRLELKQISFLKNLSNNQIKLAVFVPASHLNDVAEAIHQAGGGIIGEYSNCSFRTEGSGTFKGSLESNPSLGNKGKTELVKEVKLEVLVDEWKINNVINSIKKVHPYEEVAYDIYTLKNENVNYGFGAIGKLKSETNLKEFLDFVSSKLKIKSFRFSTGTKKKIETVAVCGGSCGELIDYAISKNADAFITADLKYHSFRDAEDKILLIDAGHYETEIPVLDEVQRRLKMLIAKKEKIKVLKFKGSTNPIDFYNKKGAS
ncbi:MAG: Nif3-like dinuclear metal center hexameric protein, partial [Ignavibacteriaceae bacterium]